MMNTPTLETVRLDRWLFAVRIFKTRGMAARAIAAGKIKIDGHSVKPHRPVRVGECILYRKEGRTYQYRVVHLIERRVGAKEAQACFQLQEDPDVTPEMREMLRVYREIDRSQPRRRGKPSKRDRRLLQQLKDSD